MTTKTKRQSTDAAFAVVAQSVALASIYTTVARREVDNGHRRFGVGELRNAATVMRSGARAAADLATSLDRRRK